ncbi:MAG: metal-dependent hydrolase [Patescibacteria group bacterium]
MFLDIGIGILLSIWTSWFFYTDLTFALIIIGIIFALLPDIDFFIEFIKHGSVGGKVIREHRELIHFPIIYIPIAILIFILYGTMWATLFSLMLCVHFLHDSIGIGWGIKWLWPFSRRSYKFFSEKDGRFSSRLIVSWDHKELTGVVANHGDPNWIKNIYLRLHPVSVIEFFVFIISLLVLYFYLYLH